jgi:hypothetical protein
MNPVEIIIHEFGKNVSLALGNTILTLEKFDDKDGIRNSRPYYGRCDLRSRSSTILTGFKVSRGISKKPVSQNAIDPFHSLVTPAP